MVLLGFWFIVNAGQMGVVTRFGSVVRIAGDGPHLKWPLVEHVTKMNIQTQKEQIEASSASKDLQSVTTEIALNYNIIPGSVGVLFRKIGTDYKARIIDPAIQEAVKASTAKYTAEELITKREALREDILLLLKQKLEQVYIIPTEVSITNFSFSESFDAAIEAKVTAEQNALQAKNKLQQVEFEAQQRIESAKAEAEAIRIQAQAITQQGGAEYVRLKSVEKWNGILPVYMLGDTVPFVTVGQ
jgi:regulator of protease activity HflC (stomatin/prohibitin superfamily)